MFEAVCLREESGLAGEGLDIGALAEAMLFYQRVHVVGRGSAVEQLARQCGTDVLLELLAEGYLEFSYYPDYPVVLTENKGTPHERHLPTVVRFGNYELQQVLPEVMAKVAGARGKGRRLARRFEPHITTFTHDPDVEAHSRQDFSDVQYVASSLRTTLTLLAPEYRLPEPLRVNILDGGNERIRLETNIDFEAANRLYHARIPPSHSSLSPAYLLSQIVTVRADLNTAARHDAEMAVTPVTGALARTKVGGVLDRYTKSVENLERFQDFVLDETRAVRESINSGDRSMAEYLSVLRAASRFRDWLKGKEADANLVKEYYRAVTKDSWLDRVPTKIARFSIIGLAGMGLGALVAGLPGAMAGLGLSAADTFLLDRMARGWRPNQFVEGPLKGFVESSGRGA